jgi:hypothetical protein
MNMDVGTVRMVDHPSVNNIGALVWPDSRLWVNTKMETIKVVHPIAQAFAHRSQEASQRIGLISAFNLCNPAIFNRESNRLAKER